MRHIIGKEGKTIMQLQIDSGAQVGVSKEEPGIVRLSGSADCIARAKDMIWDIVDRANAEGGRYNGCGSEHPKWVEETMDVPQRMTGKIVGMGGFIRSDSGAKIHISEDQPKIVRISGSIDAVSRARDMISSLLKDGQEDVVEVPQSLIGHIIGMGGETIMQLQKGSGARIEYREDEPGSVR